MMLNMIGPNIDPWDILLIASLQLDSYQWPPPSGHGHSPGFQCTSLPAHIQQRRFLLFVCKTIAVLHCPFFFFFPASLPFEADFQTVHIGTWWDLGTMYRGEQGEVLLFMICSVTEGNSSLVAQAPSSPFHVRASELLVFRLLWGWL